MIKTDEFSEKLRARAIDLYNKRILIAQLSGSKQEEDLSAPVNCNGYGRIRHFHLDHGPDWSPDPLPIVPACRSLGLEKAEMMRAQVFQSAACNWRCWYCFVDYDRLSANRRVAQYLSADELLDMYLTIPADFRPLVIDLSGGQPDLTPEWAVWMVDAICKRDLHDQIYLWSDDNLSNSYFWDHLTKAERNRLVDYPHYGRVGCFKGYDEASFTFNTFADPALFTRQFEIFRQLLLEGLDLYAYVTFTSEPIRAVSAAVDDFVDRLQDIHPLLPLRTVPLRIRSFSPVQKRLNERHYTAMEFQFDVHSAWKEALASRFSSEELAFEISEIVLS